MDNTQVDTQTLSRLVAGIGQNFVYNLGYIPADKFDWKPAPKAKSVAEIVNHVLGNFHMFSGGQGEFVPVTDLESAKSAMQQAVTNFEQGLKSATPEFLAQEVKMPSLTLTQAAMMQIGTADLINHHGQITYIQTLLGDDESHFGPNFFSTI